MSTEYRLSWEMPPSIEVAAIEDNYGEHVWPQYDWGLLTSWHRVEKVTTDPWDQYNTLKAWAETREQPIRNVVLEQRPTDDWEAVS